MIKIIKKNVCAHMIYAHVVFFLLFFFSGKNITLCILKGIVPLIINVFSRKHEKNTRFYR